MGPWSTHGSSWYKCTQFKEAVKNKNFNAEEKKRENAKNEMARYGFFFERYINNERSEKIAHKNVERLDKVIALMHEVKHYPGSELTFL